MKQVETGVRQKERSQGGPGHTGSVCEHFSGPIRLSTNLDRHAVARFGGRRILYLARDRGLAALLGTAPRRNATVWGRIQNEQV